MLVDHLLGGANGDLAGLGKLVVFERGLAQQARLSAVSGSGRWALLFLRRKPFTEPPGGMSAAH